VCCVIGAAHFWATGGGFFWWAIAAAAFLVPAWLMPRILAPLKRLWLKFGHVLSLIISPVVLGLIYVSAIVPVGLLTQLFGKDLLSLKHSATAPSYWIKRNAGTPTPQSLKDQF
jgi:hypothetical protein